MVLPGGCKGGGRQGTISRCSAYSFPGMLSEPVGQRRPRAYAGETLKLIWLGLAWLGFNGGGRVWGEPPFKEQSANGGVLNMARHG